MVRTPWGRSDELRGRRLRPGPGKSPDEAEANQRERLYGAMVAAVAEHGYEKTRVADLLEISGVSRNTFYRLFDNKLDCFLATLDALIDLSGKEVVGAYAAREGSWEERLEAAFDALIESVVSGSASARLYYVESYAAGPDAIEKVERMGDQVAVLAKGALDQSPERADMPPDLLRAVLRGFRRVIQTRLRNEREQNLRSEGPQLLQWALGYRTPPESLARPRKPADLSFPHRPSDTTPHERILTAVIELMPETGYQALTVSDIAQRAAVSLSTFYASFDGKEEATIAALRRSSDRLVDVLAPAYRDAPDWPHAIGSTLRAFFGYLEREGPFALFGGVDVHTGSPLVVDVRDQLLTASEMYFAEGYRQHPGVSPIAGEAISAGIDALIFDRMRREGVERIYELAPTAIYLALAPFVGPDEACAIANASR